MIDAASCPLLLVTQFIHALQKMAPLLTGSLKQCFIKTGFTLIERQPNQKLDIPLYACIHGAVYMACISECVYAPACVYVHICICVGICLVI